MPVNFGNSPVTTPTASQGADTNTVTPVQSVDRSISLDLTKDSILDLSKHDSGLVNLLVGCGWDCSASGTSFDLDISAYCLSNGKLLQPYPDNIIYFKHKKIKGIELLEDNRDGKGEGDDEQIIIKLNEVDNAINEIVFCVNIYECATRLQTFGQINSSFIRLENVDTHQELGKFDLKENFTTETAVIFGKLKRNSDGWEFISIGEGKTVNDLNALAGLFI